MPTDPRLEPWLDEWEAQHTENPALTPEQFLQVHARDVPDHLLEDLRNALAELQRMAGVLDRMKALDRKAEQRARNAGRE